MYKIKQLVGVSVYTDEQLLHEKLIVHPDPDNEGFYVLKDSRAASEVALDFIVGFINAKQEAINTASKIALNSITSQYTREEIDSWPTQEAEAVAWQADNAALTPLIDAMVANRPSVDKPMLVSRISANSAAYKSFSGAVIGQKQALVDKLNALDPATATKADIDAIAVEF